MDPWYIICEAILDQNDFICSVQSYVYVRVISVVIIAKVDL